MFRVRWMWAALLVWGPAGVLAQTAAPAVEKLGVPGLAAPAQIVVDRWGVPHIYAASTDDVFFVQGFNAARDRLFQIDLWRRRGLGRLASVFGPAFVEQDRAARLFLYRGDMAREWAAYGRDAQRIATRFVAGVNAYIDLVAKEPSRLPFEFGHFGYAPEKWTPEDVVRIRSHGLTRNLGSEFSRAVVACRSTLKSDGIRVRLQPPWEPQLPVGLDPCEVPYEVMRTFGLATQGVVLPSRAPGEGRRSSLEPGEGHASGVRTAEVSGLLSPEGSNAWVVAPSRSATGRPILASDPHRSYSAPSLRYIVHLNAPGLSVIGGGEPALPGVSIGHNGTAAFGLTIFAVDQEDLYVYETNPSNPREYRYQGKWEKMKAVSESIPVQGAARPASAELLFTRHGPVVHLDGLRQRAYAVRTAWGEPGMAPYFGSIEYMHAKSFADFRRAMGHWGAPAENQLYADVKGDIGWVTGGFAPVRPNWDGLLPVPGDGRYEWTGSWSAAQLPWALNPPQGFIVSANEMNLPADYPYRERKLGFEWSAPSRFKRITEVLSSLPKHGIEDAMRLQNDVLSVTARRMQAVLKAVPLATAPARSAAQLLLAWDGVERGDSAAAALFEIWWTRHLGPTYKDAVAPRSAAVLLPSADLELVMSALERPDAMLPELRRNEVVERSLQLAWQDALKLLGPDPAAWQWSKLHTTTFLHPLANAADAAAQARLNVGPFPKQGGSDTVNVSSFDPATFRQAGGPSFRVVIDVGDWDNSRAVNTPGQSGDPASPHYRDLAPLWLKGEYFPLLYTRAKVDAAAERRIELTPLK